MSTDNDIKVKIWWDAAMRANPDASPEFLLKALTQTVRKDGYEGTEDECRQHLIDSFATIRENVGSKYHRAPMSLDRTGVARLFGRPPTASLPEEDVLPDDAEGGDETGAEPVESTSAVQVDGTANELGETEYEYYGSPLAESLHQALLDEGLEVIGMSRARRTEEGPQSDESQSMTVRVEIDDNLGIQVLDAPEGERGDKIRQALNGLVLPEEAAEPGTIDLQIDFASPESPEPEA